MQPPEQMHNDSPFITPPAEQKNKKMFVTGIILGLVILVVGLIALTLYRVYSGAKTDNFTLAVSQTLRLPALKINGQPVYYTEYAEDLEAIKILHNYDAQNNGPTANYTPEMMSDQVLWRLTNTVLINDAAARFGLTVEESDLTELRDAIKKQFKTPEEIDAALKAHYGWDLVTYERKVLRPAVLQQKLKTIVEGDAGFKESVRQEAQKILDQVKGGADFSLLAQRYGYDATAERGGELGWFAKGEMVPEFEEAAFNLKPGELDQNLVETQFGFHILKVSGKRTEKVKDSNGKTINQDQVQASHILFAPTVGKYLDMIARQSDIHLYLNVHDPFAELKQQ